MQYVAQIASGRLPPVDAHDKAAPIRPIQDFQALSCHGIADLEGLADDELFELRIVQGDGSSLPQVRDRRPRFRTFARILARRIPDRRRPRAILDGRGDTGRRRNTEFFRVVRRPARCRDLQHARVVESKLARVELRVRPDRLQLDCPDGVGVRGVLHVDGIAHGRELRPPAAHQRIGALCAKLAARPGDVVDLLEDLSVSRPALDDLDAIEIGIVGILDRPHDEGRCLRPGGRQLTAHRYAVRIPRLDPVLVSQNGGREVPAAEEPHLDPHAAGAEGLLALHGREDRLARVFLGPHTAQPRRRKPVRGQYPHASRR